LEEEKQLEISRKDQEYCETLKAMIDKVKVENSDHADEVNRNWRFVLESERMTSKNNVSSYFYTGIAKRQRNCCK
jgi:hypothetical protein